GSPLLTDALSVTAPAGAQMCTRCIMDVRADRNIHFNERGVCNHCRRYDDLVAIRTLRGAEGRAALDALMERVRRAGRGREYDCIIGVSGGVDSTYVAWLARAQYGLRPLA